MHSFLILYGNADELYFLTKFLFHQICPGRFLNTLYNFLRLLLLFRRLELVIFNVVAASRHFFFRSATVARKLLIVRERRQTTPLPRTSSLFTARNIFFMPCRLFFAPHYLKNLEH